MGPDHSGTRRKPLIARSRQREPPFKLIKIGESPPLPCGWTDLRTRGSVPQYFSTRFVRNRHQQRAPLRSDPSAPSRPSLGGRNTSRTRNGAQEPFSPTWCRLPIADICIRTHTRTYFSGVTRTGHQRGHPVRFLAMILNCDLRSRARNFQLGEGGGGGGEGREHSRPFSESWDARLSFLSPSPDLGAVWRIGLASYPVPQGVT